MNRFLKMFLVFYLIGFFWAANWRQESESLKFEKTISDYWDGSGISLAHLHKVIKDKTCYQSQSLFLACVSAINSAFDHAHKKLDFSGKLTDISKQDLKINKTQKDTLMTWINQYGKVKFSFESILDKNYLTSYQIAQAINGFLSVYKDPHTYIVPLKFYEEVMVKNNNKINELGMITKKINGHLVIKKVFKNSLISQHGIKAGDQILTVNNKSLDYLTQSEINEVLNFDSNHKIALDILSSGKNKYFSVSESDIGEAYPNITSQTIDDKKGIAVLSINKFSKGTCEDARKEIIDLKGMGMNGLVLDLRDNPGGQVDEAACVINLFTAKDTLMFMMKFLDTSKSDDMYFAKEAPTFNGPLAVLINSGSASSSEIVSGSLKDSGRAILVGERSFGKGSFQDGLIWAEDSKVALFETRGLYYFPTGWTPQGSGIEPDMSVPFNNTELRESELFYATLKPVNSWPSTPGFLGFLDNQNCTDSIFETGSNDDPQITKAQSWLSCNSNRGQNDRNGSL